jgi:hypothetical protein
MNRGHTAGNGSEAVSGGREGRTCENFENGLVYIPRRHIMFRKFVVPFRIHKFRGHSFVSYVREYNLFLASLCEKIKHFMISLDAPQPPPFPSIWLFLPRVVFHWASATINSIIASTNAS